MGTGLSRAPQPRGADQEGRRRSQRARARGPHLRAGRVPLDRQAGPAQPPPLVGALHPTQAGRAGRAHRQRRTRGARGRVLHAADPDRRRGDDRRAAAIDRVGERALRPRRRRRHRPSERAAALDPDRGHARDLGGPGRRGAHDAGSLRRHPAGDPGVPARGGHRRRGDRRHARDPRGGRALPGRPRVLEPAPQVQDLDQRMHRRLHEPGDQRHLLQRGHRPGRRARLRPVRRRRSVHQPDVRPAPGRLRGTRPRRRGVGRP